MPANRLYHTWFDRIRQLCPTARRTTVRNFTWLLVGIYLSCAVQLSVIGNKIPGRTKLYSKVQRFRRLLMSRICVRKWYGPIAEEMIKNQAKRGDIRLIVDASKVSFHHQLLMVALAYRRRSIPIVWTWINCKRGHSSAIKQLALLKYVHKLIPESVSVSIVGDCEFGAVDILRRLDTWQWKYVLRQKGNTLIDHTLHNQWQRFDSLVSGQGQSCWLKQCFLTKEHFYRTNLLAHWKRGEKQPWLLTTNLDSSKQALRAYRRRMWIEEMFGDFKGHGFNLEDSHLRHFLRLSRLTLAVVLLYIWLVAFGSRTIKNSQRSLVDRADRRDFSIFRIGYNMVERRLTNLLALSTRLIPYF